MYDKNEFWEDAPSFEAQGTWGLDYYSLFSEHESPMDLKWDICEIYWGERDENWAVEY